MQAAEQARDAAQWRKNTVKAAKNGRTHLVLDKE